MNSFIVRPPGAAATFRPICQYVERHTSAGNVIALSRSGRGPGRPRGLLPGRQDRHHPLGPRYPGQAPATAGTGGASVMAWHRTRCSRVGPRPAARRARRRGRPRRAGQPWSRRDRRVPRHRRRLLPLSPEYEVLGPDPDRRDYGSFARFSDPDGNGWVLQEVKQRAAGRSPRVVGGIGSVARRIGLPFPPRGRA
jgi:hypothetical protein